MSFICLQLGNELLNQFLPSVCLSLSLSFFVWLSLSLPPHPPLSLSLFYNLSLVSIGLFLHFFFLLSFLPLTFSLSDCYAGCI